MIHHCNLPHHFIVCSASSSMRLSLIVCCVFSIGNRPWRLANDRSCFSIPVGSILELLGSSSKSTVFSLSISTVAPFVSTVLQHPSAQFGTIRQFTSAPFICYSSVPFISYSSAPFVSLVLHHSLATDLHLSSVQFCTIR